jgi:hypothetical protein
VLVAKSLVVLVVINVVIVSIVAKVDAQIEVVDEPLEPKWSRKVK